MIQAWLFGVGILFILAELGIWLKQFILPLPIYILAGAFLAIASNYERGIMALFRQSDVVDAEIVTVEDLKARVLNLKEFSRNIAVLPDRQPSDKTAISGDRAKALNSSSQNITIVPETLETPE